MPWFPAIVRFVRAAQLTPALLWGLAGKLWAGCSAPVTAVVVYSSFSPEIQGYHYTFLALLGIQVFFELGLSGVLTTFASHEWARLRLDGQGRLEGDPEALSRLASLARFSLRWFGVCAVALSLGLAVGGEFLFSARDASRMWAAPFLVLSILTGLQLAILPIWALLTGCNQVAETHSFRLFEGVVRNVVLWAAMGLGAGLWSAPLSTFAALVWAVVFLRVRYFRFLDSLRRVKIVEKVRWKEEVLPLQWRIALTWLSGYFMFSLFTPALFHFQGPVPAGQMGLTWSLVSGVSGMASLWTQTRIPQFGIHVANRDFSALDRTVVRACLMSLMVASLGGFAVFVAAAALLYRGHPLSARVIPLLPLGLFLLAEVVHQVPIAESSYLRAFKKEPFLWLGVSNGIFVGGASIVCARHFGPTGVALAYLGGILLAFGWGSLIFIRRRREWTCCA